MDLNYRLYQANYYYDTLSHLPQMTRQLHFQKLVLIISLTVILVGTSVLLHLCCICEGRVASNELDFFKKILYFFVIFIRK